jgi:hypothetical protein
MKISPEVHVHVTRILSGSQKHSTNYEISPPKLNHRLSAGPRLKDGRLVTTCDLSASSATGSTSPSFDAQYSNRVPLNLSLSLGLGLAILLIYCAVLHSSCS